MCCWIIWTFMKTVVLPKGQTPLCQCARFKCSFHEASPQEVRNKLERTKVCLLNSITTTCCQLAMDLLAASWHVIVSPTSPQQVGNSPIYGEVTGTATYAQQLRRQKLWCCWSANLEVCRVTRPRRFVTFLYKRPRNTLTYLHKLLHTSATTSDLGNLHATSVLQPHRYTDRLPELT